MSWSSPFVMVLYIFVSSAYKYIIIIIINDSIYPAVSKASRTGNKVSCQPNDCLNRWVFKRCLKMASDGAETMSAGRSFQTRGRRSFVVVCDAQAASESSPIAVVSASRPCLTTVGLSPGSSVQSGCDSGTQERLDETWCVQGRVTCKASYNDRMSCALLLLLLCSIWRAVQGHLRSRQFKIGVMS